MIFSFNFMKIDIESKQVKNAIKNKKVVFITTKNIDYIRNQQEIGILRKYSKDVKEIGSLKKTYFLRILEILPKIILLKKKEYDVIFIGFLSQSILPFFYFLFKKKIIIIDFFISLYDTVLFDRKKVNKKSVIAKILKWMDSVTLRKADFILVDTKSHGKYFVKEFGANQEKMIVLYLEADKRIYYPHIVEKPDDIKEKYIVLYFGTILPVQGIEIIKKTVEMLEDNDAIFFIIIGNIPVSQKKKYSKLSNLKTIKWLKQEELSDYIAMSDLCLAGHFNDKINKAKRTIPGKAFIYNAMNKPMILGDNITNREIFSEEKNNIFFVEMGNSKKLMDKILEIYRSSNSDT